MMDGTNLPRQVDMEIVPANPTPNAGFSILVNGLGCNPRAVVDVEAPVIQLTESISCGCFGVPPTYRLDLPVGPVAAGEYVIERNVYRGHPGDPNCTSTLLYSQQQSLVVAQGAPPAQAVPSLANVAVLLMALCILGLAARRVLWREPA
jgi:hypothetical protein